MFTYDEWGKCVFHIQTGREGMKVLQDAGFVNMPKDEYEKHMTSHRKIQAERDEQVWSQLRKMFNLSDDWNK
jgi:hypothetical protein